MRGLIHQKAEERLLELFETRLAELSEDERERTVNAALDVDVEEEGPCED